MGEILVEEHALWGAQTQRSLQNFAIGAEQMPSEIIAAFAILKSSCAKANAELGKLSQRRCDAICAVCEEIAEGRWAKAFPLKVWQTGSGTQTNMNVNEVIATLASKLLDGERLHPNDDVNMSQSSNDTFPTAMSIAGVLSVTECLLPAIDKLADTFARLEEENQGILKIGRTHLQDSTPVAFSQEISGWRAMLTETRAMITQSLAPLRALAIGGTAVGTGLNAPKGFGEATAAYISQQTGEPFVSAANKFHALTSKDAFVFTHGAIKALAANLMKIANDVRWLASGPRCGIGEITIPENEPGSSIMPGKVNPTQCEALTMVAVQVLANDVAVSMAASQGNFQLNVFLPVCAYNFLQSVRLLSDAIGSFHDHCAVGIRPNVVRMRENLENSLMLVTCLTPKLGYDRAAGAAKHAFAHDLTLKESVLQLELLSAEEFDELVDPAKMV